jgi:hypothetical protein
MAVVRSFAIWIVSLLASMGVGGDDWCLVIRHRGHRRWHHSWRLRILMLGPLAELAAQSARWAVTGIGPVSGPQPFRNISLKLFSAARRGVSSNALMRGQSVAPIPRCFGERNRGHCLLTPRQATKLTLPFFEGENIVFYSQNRHACDRLVTALFHIAVKTEACMSRRITSAFATLKVVSSVPKAWTSPGCLFLRGRGSALRVTHERALSQAILSSASAFYRLPALN